jgi:hypothetical protein
MFDEILVVLLITGSVSIVGLVTFVATAKTKRRKRRV